MIDITTYLKSDRESIEFYDTLYVDMSLGRIPRVKNLVVEAFAQQIGSTRYWYRIDNPFGEPRPGNLRHMHGYVGKKSNLTDVFAMNSDGTAHDGWHKTEIPSEFIPVLKDKGFTIPNNNMIEMMVMPSSSSSLILESRENSQSESLHYSKFEINEAVLKLGGVIRHSDTLVLGITNIPLNRIYRMRRQDGFRNIKVIYISGNYDNVKMLCTSCNNVVSEITFQHNKVFEEIDNTLVNAAFVMYAAYI